MTPKPSQTQPGRPASRARSVFSPARLLERMTAAGLSMNAVEARMLEASNVNARVATYLGGSRPSPEVLHALAAALGCTMESLFDEVGN